MKQIFKNSLLFVSLVLMCTLNASVASAETLVVNAYGDQTRNCTFLLFCTDTFPNMTVYVNGVSYGMQEVSSTAQDYSFNVTLPSSDPVNIDVLFDNDAYYGSLGILFGNSGDRNLFINSITIGNKTFSPTGSGVIKDIGDGYAAATDGVNTSTYSSGMYNNAALRMSSTLAEIITPATLIAEYHFEEDSSWNGTSNELKDSAGHSSGPFDGLGAGTPIPTQVDTSPAISGSSGTCEYANFSNRDNGSIFTLDSLPVDTSASAKTSVSFWMYWDGANNVMPIGWNRHNLWFRDGAFGFNTWANDIYGISSSGLANGWHHVVAVFTNGNVTNNALYIDGVKQTLSQKRGSPNNANAYVQSTLQVSGATNSTSYRFSGGSIDEVKVYNGEVSQSEVSTDFAATHSCLDIAEPIAQYHLDETSWDGTSNEVIDDAGYSGGPFHGTSIGSTKPQANFTSRARTGDSGTCGYAELNGPVSGGAAFSLTNLPFDTANDSKNTISFWMYWDGTDNVMPFSSGNYGLLFSGNKFGFTTDGTDVYGIDGTSLANGWHHVVAVFNQGNIEQNKLYIDSNLQTLSQQIGGGSTLRVVKAELDAADYSIGFIVPNAPWTTDNSGGTLEFGNSNTYNVSGTVRRMIELEQHYGDASNIKATVSTNVGDTVYVSFDHAEVVSTGYFASDFKLFINGSEIAQVDRDSLSFAHYEYSATTNSTSTSIELRSTSNNAIGSALDDITIEVDDIASNLSSSVQVGGSTTDTSKRFTGRVDEIKFYKGEIDQTQVTVDYNAVHACPSYIVNVDAHDFNCIAKLETDVANGKLYTQTFNNTFDIKVIALKADNTPETDFSALSDKDLTLEFIDKNNSNTPIRFNLYPLGLATSRTITFPAGDNTGILPVDDVVMIDAYQNIGCRITDNNQSPAVTAISSDAFSVRPQSFTVTHNVFEPDTSLHVNASISGLSKTATPVFKAGEPFQLLVYAGSNYAGAPKIDTAKIVAHNDAVNTGILNNTSSGIITGAFNQNDQASGTATGTNFSYSEVGYFGFNPYGVFDDDWTAIDQPNDCTDDFSNTAVNGKIGCKIGNSANTMFYGRFIPDHFTITQGTVTPVCNSQFTYFGQDGLKTSFIMTAENSNYVVTQNYTGDYTSTDYYAKFPLNSWANYQFTASGLPTGATLTSGTTSSTVGWVNGAASVSATHLITRPTNPAAPSNIVISAQPYENTSDDGVTASAAAAVAGASEYRFGRMAMQNAYGSELQGLSVPIEVQYWDGTTYRTNDQDDLNTCTTLASSALTLSNHTQNLSIGETIVDPVNWITINTANPAKASIHLTAPGAGNNGSVNLDYDLTNLSWFGSNPSAKATFGINKTSVIYIRENY